MCAFLRAASKTKKNATKMKRKPNQKKMKNEHASNTKKQQKNIKKRLNIKQTNQKQDNIIFNIFETNFRFPDIWGRLRGDFDA